MRVVFCSQNTSNHIKIKMTNCSELNDDKISNELNNLTLEHSKTQIILTHGPLPLLSEDKTREVVYKSKLFSMDHRPIEIVDYLITASTPKIRFALFSHESVTEYPIKLGIMDIKTDGKFVCFSADVFPGDSARIDDSSTRVVLFDIHVNITTGVANLFLNTQHIYEISFFAKEHIW